MLSHCHILSKDLLITDRYLYYYIEKRYLV